MKISFTPMAPVESDLGAHLNHEPRPSPNIYVFGGNGGQTAVLPGDLAVQIDSRPVKLSVDDAAKKLSISADSVYRRAIPWQEDPVPHKIRWKILKLDQETEEGRRFLEEDVEALLFDPPKMEQPGRRKLFVRKG